MDFFVHILCRLSIYIFQGIRKNPGSGLDRICPTYHWAFPNLEFWISEKFGSGRIGNVSNFLDSLILWVWWSRHKSPVIWELQWRMLIYAIYFFFNSVSLFFFRIHIQLYSYNNIGIHSPQMHTVKSVLSSSSLICWTWGSFIFHDFIGY